MDWISAGFSLAQKHAQDAAEKAKQLAQQAAGQARVLAEQAKEAATNIAKAAAEEAQGLKTSTRASTKGEPSAVEVAAFAVTDELTDFIKSLTYVTFSDYPKEDLKKAWDLAATATSDVKGEFRLNPWQERHALVVLQTVPHLEDLRFVLCPRRMDEGEFWKIYFALAKPLLPPQAFTGELPEIPSASQLSASGDGTSKAHAIQMSAISTPASTAAGDTTTTARGPTAIAGITGDTSPSRHTSETVLNNFAWSEMEGDADAELETYLKEALASGDGEGGAGGSSAADSSELGDLDEYLDQLNIEEEAAAAAKPGGAAAASTPSP